MYQVSEQYIEALKSPAKVRRLTGTVGVASFTQENIISSSLIIDNKCSEGDQVKIGSVYIGQLSVVFTNIDFPGTWFNKEITISEGLLLKDETWEDIPLGVFHVVEANRAEDGIHVTAYDNMDRFDKDFVLSSTSGTAYDFLHLICQDCNVQMAQTEQEIRALPNGTYTFILYVENDISTYRDLLGWVAQTVGCFATIDRLGRLVLRQYGTEIVDSITPTDRWRGSSFSDFVTKYTSVSLYQIDKESAIVKRAEVDDGLMYELGANPLLQEISVNGPLNNLLSALARIEYSPFVVYRSGCAAYDLGDKVEFPGGYGKGAIGCIMSYQYNYHVDYRMEGFGSNPTLIGAKSKTDKQISGLMKSNSIANQMQYYPYTNASPYVIHDDYKEIIYIRFASVKDTIVVFHAEVKLKATSLDEHDPGDFLSVIGNIKYIWNYTELDYHPKETWIEGMHILHLFYLFNVDGGELNTLSVRMNTDGEIEIQALDIQACVAGQGLVATSSWDGYLGFDENVNNAAFSTEPSDAGTIDEEMQINLIPVAKLVFTEGMHPAEFVNEPEGVEPYDGAPYINKDAIRSGHRKWGGDGTPTSVIRLGTWQNVKADYGW